LEVRNDVKVSAREKKILYAGMAIAAAIFIYHLADLFSPGDGESIADKVEMQEGLLRRQKELIGRKGFYETRVEDAEKDIEKIRNQLLPVNSASAAGTELQRILSELADRSNVVITQKSNQMERKIADSDSLIKVSVQVSLQCSLEDLVDFLIAIKNYDRFLRVEQMTINTVTEQRRLVMRRSLNLSVAGYISVPPPAESAAQPATAAVRKNN
jgi:hypothetical protein